MSDYECGRSEDPIPLSAFYQMALENDELACLYLGFAAILLRYRDHVLAFDLSQESLFAEEITALEKLDLSFHSHTHFDHWDLESCTRIQAGTGAALVVEPQVAEAMQAAGVTEGLHTARAGTPLMIAGCEITPVTGIHPRPITIFHVRMDGLRLFHGADSGPVPLGALRVEVAFLPVGDPSPSCSPRNALQMACDLQPHAVVAMHAAPKQLQEFRRLMKAELPDTIVLLPRPGELLRVALSV
ncbi:MAG: MBL fold metallo-hydrolase [Anaerolineales bacterium]|nr:MBL fold metallo-hydrolase [Anaerolineales bacterium]